MASGPRAQRSIDSCDGERLPLLTRDDQGAVFVLVAIALIFITAGWLISAVWRGGLVDIDVAEPLRGTFQIDINSAGWTELAQLPEIGEALANRIIETREREGPFTSLDDLDRVRGIGPTTLDKIRPFIRPID
jgi:competence protein ComEA